MHPANMSTALALARGILGRTAPNPAVGAVLVKDARTIGTGHTQPGGRPHAETMAIQDALQNGFSCQGATLYVTLEPCAHHGQTPPCVDAILAAGISEVLIACSDPDPRVAGKGIAALRAAGLQVTCGLLEAEAHTLNQGFFKRIQHGTPWVTAKIATSIDGKIATATGESKWITCEASRNYGQTLRACHDAIAVGIGTVLADDPALTCRLEGIARTDLIRIVFDRQFRMPETAQLVRTASTHPCWIVTTTHALEKQPEKHQRLLAEGVQILSFTQQPTPQADMQTMLETLGQNGLTRVLLEGGSTLLTACLEAQQVDCCYWFTAPILLGNHGIPAIGPLSLPSLSHAPRFYTRSIEKIGTDSLTIYDKTTPIL